MKINQPGPHLDHMLRQTRLHHAQLSTMADLKANMLLTLASVAISLTAPHLFKPQFAGPALLFSVGCLLTIGLAIYAVMPKIPIPSNDQSRPDIKSPTFNLLFFGDFIRLGYDEFEAAMEETMNDHSQTYQVQIRELYTLGVFLARKKYRFLRLAYLSFMAGLFGASLLLLLITLQT